MPLEAAATSQRLTMAVSLFMLATHGTRLEGPRLGDGLHIDPVLLTDVRELIETMPMRPEDAALRFA